MRNLLKISALIFSLAFLIMSITIAGWTYQVSSAIYKVEPYTIQLHTKDGVFTVNPETITDYELSFFNIDRKDFDKIRQTDLTYRLSILESLTK